MKPGDRVIPLVNIINAFGLNPRVPGITAGDTLVVKRVAEDNYVSLLHIDTGRLLRVNARDSVGWGMLFG